MCLVGIRVFLIVFYIPTHFTCAKFYCVTTSSTRAFLWVFSPLCYAVTCLWLYERIFLLPLTLRVFNSYFVALWPGCNYTLVFIALLLLSCSWPCFLVSVPDHSPVQVLLRHRVCDSRVLTIVSCLSLMFYRMRNYLQSVYKVWLKCSFTLIFGFQIADPSNSTIKSSSPISSLTDEDLSLLRSLVLVSYEL